MTAPFSTGAYWLLLVCAPFSIIIIWLAKTLLKSWISTAFLTTILDFGEQELVIRNFPFGSPVTVKYADIEECIITDIADPKLCLEALLLARSHRTIQVCAFRNVNPKIETMIAAINARAEQVGAG